MLDWPLSWCFCRSIESQEEYMASREPWLTFYDLAASQQEGVGTEAVGTSGWGLGTGDAGGFGMGLCSATQVPHMPSTCRCLKTGEHLHPRALAHPPRLFQAFLASTEVPKCTCREGTDARPCQETAVVAGSPVWGHICVGELVRTE